MVLTDLDQHDPLCMTVEICKNRLRSAGSKSSCCDSSLSAVSRFVDWSDDQLPGPQVISRGDMTRQEEGEKEGDLEDVTPSDKTKSSY